MIEFGSSTWPWVDKTRLSVRGSSYHVRDRIPTEELTRENAWCVPCRAVKNSIIIANKLHTIYDAARGSEISSVVQTSSCTARFHSGETYRFNANERIKFSPGMKLDNHSGEVIHINHIKHERYIIFAKHITSSFINTLYNLAYKTGKNSDSRKTDKICFN